MRKKLPTILLLGILMMSFVFHVFNIGYPPQPVFDEVYFTTAAASYAAGTPYFDIHPPLGKLIYAIPLFFEPNHDYSKYKFIEIKWNPEEERLDTNAPLKNYGDFPYVSLRLINAFFGIFLILGVFLFTKQLSKSYLPPLIAAFFVALESSLLTETRFIFLNGMYLTFGFLALAAIFSKKKAHPLLGGVLWGLALSVKLIGIVFIGPLLLGMLLKRDNVPLIKKRDFLIFFGTGLLILTISMLLINNVFISPQERIDYYKTLMPWIHPKENLFEPSELLAPLNHSIPYLIAPAIEATVMLSGYTMGVPLHPMRSTWYEWPFMQKPLWFFSDRSDGLGTIFLTGNPVIWALVTLTIIFGILFFLYSRFKKIGLLNPFFTLLLGSYIFALVPYTLIERPAFLYHYFPALIFGIILLSLMLGMFLENKSRQERIAFLTIGAALTILGFITTLQTTYGLPLIN